MAVKAVKILCAYLDPPSLALDATKARLCVCATARHDGGRLIWLCSAHKGVRVRYTIRYTTQERETGERAGAQHSLVYERLCPYDKPWLSFQGDLLTETDRWEYGPTCVSIYSPPMVDQAPESNLSGEERACGPPRISRRIRDVFTANQVRR